jgi:hypothetical protein
MGGKGSTRWGYRGDYVPPLTIHEASEIRARGLFRQQPPQIGRSVEGRLEASTVGPVDFTIDGTNWPVTVRLRFSESLRAAGLALPEDTSLWLLPTQPTYGGERWWIVCPACGRRCGAVYLVPRGRCRQHGMLWACRRCQALVYPSQHEAKGDRALRKLRTVLHHAGAAWSPFLLPRHRPKGMHRRTFDRLCAQAEIAFCAAAAASNRSARVLRTGTLWR